MLADARLAALVALFSYPDEALLGEQADPGSVLPDSLKRTLKSTALVALEGEYVRLFVNALPEVPCPPYASVYLEGALMGESTARVRDLYRRWGVDTEELPDHFAVECAFLGVLEGAPVEDRRARADLDWLVEHLAAWTPEFFDRVERHDRSAVYREAARFGRTVIGEHVERRRGHAGAGA